jgi:hypothetical protein
MEIAVAHEKFYESDALLVLTTHTSIFDSFIKHDGID